MVIFNAFNECGKEGRDRITSTIGKNIKLGRLSQYKTKKEMDFHLGFQILLVCSSKQTYTLILNEKRKTTRF